jgi:photosynthetic reaction center H subunit
MESGAITGYIDVAQLVLYAFWIFFAGLIYYLRREDKREGYPLESAVAERGRAAPNEGFPRMPAPKTFLLPHGGTQTAPRAEAPRPVTGAAPIGGWPGAPLQPTGNPMLDGVGPASYALRAETPDLTVDGTVKIVPLRVATDTTIAEEDPDPRGMAVLGADGAVAGKVKDVWVDRSEAIIRYLEVDAGGRSVLLPMTLARVDGDRRQVRAASVLATQFADAPALAMPDQVTLREEDRICAYFASGHLYAEPARLGPLL